MTLPEPRADWALFLDLDGSIIEIAETPDTVRVEPGLKQLLGELQRVYAGALAIVSGRSIDALDRLLGPMRFAAAGLHGLERRDAAGALTRPPKPPASFDGVRDALDAFVSRHRGLALEDKTATLALHYRGAPRLAARCRRAVANAVNGTPFEILSGKMVIEIKPTGVDKGRAIEAFLDEAPFRGRTPVFCGDDVTDEHGFAAVNRRGGISIRVAGDGPTEAAYGVDSVGTMVAWLGRVAEGPKAA